MHLTQLHVVLRREEVALCARLSMGRHRFYELSLAFSKLVWTNPRICPEFYFRFGK